MLWSRNAIIRLWIPNSDLSKIRIQFYSQNVDQILHPSAFQPTSCLLLIVFVVYSFVVSKDINPSTNLELKYSETFPEKKDEVSLCDLLWYFVIWLPGCPDSASLSLCSTHKSYQRRSNKIKYILRTILPQFQLLDRRAEQRSRLPLIIFRLHSSIFLADPSLQQTWNCQSLTSCFPGCCCCLQIIIFRRQTTIALFVPWHSYILKTAIACMVCKCSTTVAFIHCH